MTKFVLSLCLPFTLMACSTPRAIDYARPHPCPPVPVRHKLAVEIIKVRLEGDSAHLFPAKSNPAKAMGNSLKGRHDQWQMRASSPEIALINHRQAFQAALSVYKPINKRRAKKQQGRYKGTALKILHWQRLREAREAKRAKRTANRMARFHRRTT